MEDALRQQVIEKLRRGEDLPAEWARELFPPAKREFELTYHGKKREEEIIAETLAVPLQPASEFGSVKPDWHNLLIFGENLQVLKTLLEMKDQGTLRNSDGSPGVRLVYIDPPFGTGNVYAAKGAAAAYSAALQGARYVEFLRKRLTFLKNLLSEDGSIYIRIDYHFGHYVKMILDEVFGKDAFLNELIVNRVTKKGFGANRFPTATDSVFFYKKNEKYLFNGFKKKIDIPKKPRWHAMDSMSASGTGHARKIFGQLMKPPEGRGWTFSQKRIDEMSKDGKIKLNSKGKPIYFLEGSDTDFIDSNWTDIPGYAVGSASITGYPTENSELLLERIVSSSSGPGDVVLDCFAGSGTALAVAEKLGRRWIAVDCGKLAIYSMQKRMLNLRKEIGNDGAALKPNTFVLYNAGLYDFGTLRRLPWGDWRFFALRLFNCRDEPHTIGGINLDGKLKGGSVLVYNHTEKPDRRIDEDSIRDIHSAVGDKVGNRFYVIAPRAVFDFQQDYIDLDGVRYYALRIPYSIINELHQREFTSLQQPTDELAVNETVEAVGFDFIRPPEVKWEVGISREKGKLVEDAYLRLRDFRTKARIRGKETEGGLDSFAMLMLDFDYDGEVFVLDSVHYSQQMKHDSWTARFPADRVGGSTMAIFLDIYGNEARELIPMANFEKHAAKARGK